MRRTRLIHLALLACLAQSLVFAQSDRWPDCKQSADPDLAIDACTAILASGSGDDLIQADFYRAVAYFSKHDYYHAAKDFTAVLDIRQVQAAYLYRGFSYINQINDDPDFANAAISDLNAASNMQPAVEDKDRAQFWLAYITRAATNLKNGSDSQAQSDEEQALQLSPDNAQAIHASFAQAYQERAMKHLAAGEYDEAASDLQSATTLDATTADKLAPYLAEAQSKQPGPYAAIARGDQHLNDQDYEQAVKDYSDAIQASPQLADLRLNRGYAYLELDRYDEARADFDEAIRVAPTNWAGFYGRGQLELSLSRFDKAAADFDQAAGVVEQAHDAGYDYEKGRIDNARKKLKFDRSMDDRWIAYLKGIQANGTYPNWSERPYDLFVKNRAQDLGLAQPNTAPVSLPQTENATQRRWSRLVFGLIGILLFVGAILVVVNRRQRVLKPVGK